MDCSDLAMAMKLPQICAMYVAQVTDFIGLQRGAHREKPSTVREVYS